TLVNINAYHQPGVEAGKKAATRVLQLQSRVEKSLGGGSGKTAAEIAGELEADPEDVFHILRHLAANNPGIHVFGGPPISEQKFSRVP
ncbi:MAG: glucose-6-phosphate isomerase, partial [Verrucomicrobiota bacterium]